MGRNHRIIFPGAIYHVYDRGNEKQDIFNDDLERFYFLKLLKNIKTKYRFKLHAYVLMSNHYHFVIQPDDISISKIMQVFKTKYSHYFNHKNNRVGHLFQGVFQSKLVEDNEYLTDLMMYVHLNPMRKRMVKNIDDYVWSSHAEFTGGSKAGLADKEVLLDMFGGGDEALDEYRGFIGNNWGEKEQKRVEDFFDKLVFGSKKFTDDIHSLVKKAGKHAPEWGFRGSWAHPEDILIKTANAYNVSREELIMKKGKWNRAKKAAIFLLWKNTTLSAAEIAATFNKQHPSGLKRIIQSVEEESGENEVFRGLLSSIQKSLLKTGAKHQF